MMNLGRMRSGWRVLWTLRKCEHVHNRTSKRGTSTSGRLIRLVACSLILNATFPMDVSHKQHRSPLGNQRLPNRSTLSSLMRWWPRSRSIRTIC